MKQFFTSLYLNKYFLTFVVIFAYLESVQERFSFSKSLHWHLFTPDAAIGQLLNALLLFVIIGLVLQKFEEKLTIRHALSVFSISLVLYVAGNNVLAFVVALTFDTVERNFNATTLTTVNIKYVMDVFVYGGLFLAHYYFQKNQEDKKKISMLEKVQIESQLSQLKAQLNPHFLFNNLNVLDQLIEEDQAQASVFLHDFSDIYRYVLQSSDQQLVSLEDEIAFAKRYFRLMKQKYGEAYRLQITGDIPSEAFLPALSLQLLIENAIEHNLGTERSPVEIKLMIYSQTLLVSNTLMPKKQGKKGGGRALLNLGGQLELLAEKAILVQQNERTFEVTLPLIFKNEN
ncbi:sensor histidine kinase [Mongoliitalea daihaiensis]|uniref:sensor histidine kinase n=1 Tax=Mongoliitalea daihaiensis TaxID=2782006 RepID=UPI001F386A0F|nr:histidine kinase [Mongoliitalea daihaiensis]UJP66695.1 histidine kinase [Mongoliitalea daihaiensis]